MENVVSEASWLDMTDEELEQLTDVSVCMYGRQGNSSGLN